MLELIVFALVLVVAQMVGGILLMTILLSEKFIKYYTKKFVKTMKGLEDFYEELAKELD
jgi:hypothetical protein